MLKYVPFVMRLMFNTNAYMLGMVVNSSSLFATKKTMYHCAQCFDLIPDSVVEFWALD